MAHLHTQRSLQRSATLAANPKGFTMGVVADVTAHVAKCLQDGTAQAGFTAKWGKGGPTPNQLGTSLGYTSKQCSALRHHLARQHGAGAWRTGHTRYPALTLRQWGQAMALGHLVARADATAQQRSKASSRAGALLWPKAKASSKAGAKAAKATAQQASADATAQQGTPTA